MFPLGADETPYRRHGTDHVTSASFEGRDVLKVEPEALTLLAEQARRDVAHLLRPGHWPTCAASSTTRKPRTRTASWPWSS